MKSRVVSFVILTFVVAVLVPGAIGKSFAQDNDPMPRALLAETRTAAVLDRAIEVYGGKEFLDSINNVDIELSGQSWAQRWTWNSSGKLRSVSAKTHVALQRKEGNYRYGRETADEAFSGDVMSTNSNWANTVTKDSKHLLFPLLTMATSGFALPGITEAAEAMSPHLIVAELLSKRERLTWIGEETYDGRVNDLIAYPQGIAGYSTFDFDRENGTLVGMQVVNAGGGRPDRVFRKIIGGYHEIDGVLTPSTRKSYDGDQLTMDETYEKYDLNANLDASLFGAPEDFQVFENVAGESTKPKELAPGVFWIPSGLNAMFVEFDDYVIALNTPSGRHAEQQLAAIREQVGDKPIRFAVPMDHHASNSSGLRTYVAAGIPIITTGGNRDYFTRLATVHSTLLHDALAKDPKQPKFEIVDDRRVFDDGNMRLELINVGPISHAEDIYVAYLPKQKILFSAHLFNFDPASLPVAMSDKFRPLLRENVEAIKRAGIDAETAVLAHATRVLAWTDIEKVLNSETAD